MNEVLNKQPKEEEIDIVGLLKKVYSERKFIIKTVIIASLFGFIYHYFQPKVFTSTTTFIPQLSSGVKVGGSSLSSLASLAGINIGGLESSSKFPPTLYPQVVNGIPFKLDLLSSEIKINGKILYVKDYFLEKKPSFNLIGFLKKYTIGLPSLIIKSFKKQDELVINESEIYSISSEDPFEIYSPTVEDLILFDRINSALSLKINKEEGFITISVTDSNKNIAAQLTKISQKILQEKIIEFKNQSSKEMLDFAMKQYTDNKESYEKLQDERAIFVDKNINISSSLFKNKLSRVESELNIFKSIVQQLASQVEQARLQVNKDTPVFTIIQPVTVPLISSSTKRIRIVLIFGAFGMLFSIGYGFIKDPFFKILKSIIS